MRVLVLRPHPAAARTAARLSAAGHEAIAAPVLAVKGVRAPPPDGPFDLVVATSGQAFAHAPAPPAWRDVAVLTVGERGLAAARDAGFVQVASAGPDARALADAVSARPPGRVLYLAGRDRKPHLETRLRAAGVNLVVHVVYEAAPVAHLPTVAAEAFETDEVDVVLHYSRRSAQTFCALALDAGLRDIAASTRHIAISADAAQGLAALAPSRVEIAERPDEAAMVALLG